jgi:NTP pyrophosphatase (non-canonical NTP hydrolase)
MRDLIEGTLAWAAERGLLDNGGAERQALKMVSEVGEFADEVLKGDKDKQKMELGDVLVTAILTSHKLGFDIEDALGAALNKIRNRTGKTINGVFVKD